MAVIRTAVVAQEQSRGLREEADGDEISERMVSKMLEKEKKGAKVAKEKPENPAAARNSISMLILMLQLLLRLFTTSAAASCSALICLI